jgi:hypothetical protein
MVGRGKMLRGFQDEGFQDQKRVAGFNNRSQPQFAPQGCGEAETAELCLHCSTMACTALITASG